MEMGRGGKGKRSFGKGGPDDDNDWRSSCRDENPGHSKGRGKGKGEGHGRSKGKDGNQEPRGCGSGSDDDNRSQTGTGQSNHLRKGGKGKPGAGKLPCKFWLSGDCKNGDACLFEHAGQPSGGEGPPACRHWLATGSCNFGDRCSFKHPGRSSGAGGEGGPSACKHWLTFRSCNFGDQCRFRHPGHSSGGKGRGSGPSSFGNPGTDAERFASQVISLPSTKAVSCIDQNSELWLLAWEKAVSFKLQTLEGLLNWLASLPASAKVKPPPVAACKDAVVRFCKAAGSGRALDAGELVTNVVKCLTRFEWEGSEDEIRGSLQDMIDEAGKGLTSRITEQRDVKKQLELLMEDLERPGKIKMAPLARGKPQRQQDTEFDFEDEDLPAHKLWPKATVEWLCKSELFCAPCLPKMKTPTMPGGGIYDTPDDYFETIGRLVVGMTFADGNAAIMPRCGHKNKAGSSCGATFCPLSSAEPRREEGGGRCRVRNCYGSAVVGCMNRFHKDGLCRKHKEEAIVSHLGPPGDKASTNIYDGHVAYVNTDGKMFIHDFASRAPPQHAIHWRSTRRLASPNLVAVVKLPAWGAPLRREYRILWGEITLHGDPKNESQERQNRKVAINLSSISDNFDPDLFACGECVALIDCMTFVPEYVPVLKALETAGENMPRDFEDGVLLNLHASRPPDQSNTVSEDELQDTDELVQGLIEESKLRPIREIKRDERLTEDLHRGLVRLVDETTLDRGQLVSFVDSLRNTVHLTQGPPGTGKSYLGVVIVRALILIRKLWMTKNGSVGTPPILVLSYKNHAIDEFLLDLTKSEFSVRGSLVRIGGGASTDPRLEQYSEKHFQRANLDVRRCHREMEKLHTLSRSCKELANQAGLFSSARASMIQDLAAENAGDDQSRKRRKRTTFAAVEEVMVGIIRTLLIERALEGGEVRSESSAYAGGYSDDEEEEEDLLKAVSFLTVHPGDPKCRDTRRLMSNDELMLMIPQLHAGFYHYIEANPDLEDVGEILCMFLEGKVPLPSCRYVGSFGDKCKILSDEHGVDLCCLHRCKYLMADGNATVQCQEQLVADASYWCRDHCCAVVGCPFHRLPWRGQRFCEDHACYICLQEGLLAKQAENDPPRNTCKDHPLCIILQCELLAEPGNDYCADHHAAMQASFYRGAGRWARRGWEFLRGKPDDGEDERGLGLPERQTCEGITKKGRPCKSFAARGKRYCDAHSPPDPEAKAFLPAAAAASSSPKKTIDESAKPLAAGIPSADGKAGYEKMHAAMGEAPLPQDEVPPNIAMPDDASPPALDADAGSEFSVVSAGDVVDPVDVGRYDNQDEVEEADHLQHLREVFGEVEQDSEDEGGKSSVGEEDAAAPPVNPDGGDGPCEPRATRGLRDPAEWTWELTFEERWEACQDFMYRQKEKLQQLNQKIKTGLPLARKHYRDAKARANAKVYENKSVIGGTIVGCISRLQAIRSTEPFAILVEEASEVMEPLLCSCLCRSLVKFEMIGDHLQLQPSVMQRFDYQKINNINISMFERLIRAPPYHKVPSSVLTIQRRMRKDICDLTRDYYKDIVSIEDHEVCQTKVIPGSTARESTWRGREVPGMQTHIYVWTHDGDQTKSQVGLSKMNQKEVDMSVWLAYYLVSCGVKRSSIAILTPYKGQLMAIRHVLQSDHSQTRLLAPYNEPNAEQVRLSTVDRFQGDEADIVIISLVVDQTSSTPFVKLVNRMIVLLSRARLGMYILGNSGYFDRPGGEAKHWTTTFEMLGRPSERSDSQDETIPVFDKPRVGRTLPMCCPIHPDSTAEAKKAEDLELNFCKAKCDHELRCSHRCGLDCHWPKKTHRQTCETLVDSPCARHTDQVPCHAVYKHARPGPPGRKIDEALREYRCPEKVSLRLRCSHEESLPCYEEYEISEGLRDHPECHRQSPVPFIHSECKHPLDVTCSQLAKYGANPARVPRCEEEVEFLPACCHAVRVKCYLKREHERAPERFVCPQKLPVLLPRCGHDAKVSCSQELTLRSWSGGRCREQGVVDEGGDYGPVDAICDEDVHFVRKCGHRATKRCHEAFEAARVPSACKEKVHVKNPHCGHQCEVACHERSRVEGFASTRLNVTAIDSPLVEGRVPAVPFELQFVRCTQMVEVQRHCGHVHKVQCQFAAAPPPPCTEICRTASPLCGHEVPFQCCHREEIDSWKCWPPSTLSALQDHGKLSLAIPPICQAVPGSVKAILTSCNKSLEVEKACGHPTTFKCRQLINVVMSGGMHTTCSVKVLAKLRCGHDMELPCSRHKSYQDGVEDIQCKSKDVKACWNVQHCGSNALVVPCGTKKQLCCDAITTWTCSQGHAHALKLCQDGAPIGCPLCNLEAVSNAMKNDDAALSLSLDSCFSSLNRKQISQLAEASESYRFAKARSELLGDFYERMSEKKNIWQTHQFQPTWIPVLVPLAEKQKDKGGFTPLRDFLKEEMGNCVVTYRCTAHICKALGQELSGDEGFFLFGYVFSLKAKELLSLPSGGQKKTRQRRKELLHQTFRDNNDCVEVEMSGVTKRALLVREPWAVCATHRLKMTKEDLHRVSHMLDQAVVTPLPSGRPWTFSKPSGDLLKVPARRKAAEEPSLSSAGEVAASSSRATGTGSLVAAASAVPQPLPELRGTSAEDLIFALDPAWNCQTALSISTTATDGGAVALLSAAVDGDLRQKLSFVNADASPFAGKNLLEALSEHQASPFLQLLWALELESKDQELALQYLNRYWDLVNGSQAHPLILLAMHRLRGTPEALIALARHFPLVKPLLRGEELCMVQKSEEAGDPEEDEEDYDRAAYAGPRASQADEPIDLWLELKETQGCKSEAMEKLLALTGLRKVKLTAVQLFKSALRLSQMPEQARKANLMALNYCFLGNPGTGKTTVARLFAEILYDAGLRSGQTFTELTSQQLKDEGVDAFRKKAKATLNGVIFIDEAYNLDPVGDKFKGAPIANELLTLAENERETLTIILAGYEDDMNKQFFAYNDGLKSRFQEVIFEDLSEKELAKIWTDMREEKFWREEDERVTSVLIKRLVKCSGRKGFGNAREVRRRLELATTRAMSRPDFNGQDMVLTIADVIGEDPSCNEKLQELQNKIDSKVGWKAIKKSIRELIEVSSTNYQRELNGESPLPVFLNRLFLGNPGTGKTTCAKLYAEVLKHLGFLSNGEVVEKTAGDFGGAAVGEAPQKAASILDGARGKVLVIDEAYNLDDSLYGKQVLDVIVEKVQGSENDDIAVLMLGYREPMLKMLKNQNPGLSRRFDPSQAFCFEDYTDNELLEILKVTCSQSQVRAGIEFQEKALAKLSMLRCSEPNFGNAGSVRNLVMDAMRSASSRSAGTTRIELRACDVDIGGDRDGISDEDPLLALDKLYRMDQVKKRIQEIRNAYIVAQREGGEPPELGHFVFMGSPGTGKTTVARTMAKILFSLQLIARNHVEETSGLELTGEFVGQTKKRVEERLNAARGGVLFIDEAYELGKGPYGAEACTAIVAAMTNPSYDRLVIIIAGYENEIGSMLDTNIGLKSRFTNYFTFPDWEPSDCCSLFEKLALKKSMALLPDTFQVLSDGFAALKGMGGWGNARDVDKLFKAAERQRASRVLVAPEDEKKLLASDIKPAMDGMVQDRRSSGGGLQSLMNRPNLWPMQMQAGSREHRPPQQNERQQEAEREQQLEEVEESLQAGTERRDEGVSDEVWAALQAAKEKERLREARWQRDLEEKRMLEEQVLKELEGEAAIQQAEEEYARRLEEARQARLEIERRMEEELRKEQAIKEKLRQISPCPMGFKWYKQDNGWRCGGGTHFVSDQQLNSQFAI